MLFRPFALAIAFLATAFIAPAQAQWSQSEKTEISPYDEAVFFFGGRFHKDWFGTGLVPWSLTWDDTYIAAVGYQQTWIDWYDFRIGGEVGLAGRFGADGSSAEIWAGAYARYDGFVLGNFRISPSLTFGLSVVTGTQGHEGQRIAQTGRNTPILIYLGPEFSFGLVDQPQWEVFTRFQHRSGGYGVIADLDASNAITGGVRFKY